MFKFLCVSVLAFTFSTVAIADEDLGGLKVGDKAPCADLQQIKADGTEAFGCVTAPEKTSQKFAVINFMSINCGPCNSELPEVAQLVNEISSVATYRAISVERKKYEADVRAWLKNKNAEGLINYSMALDSDHLAANAYKIKYTPTLIVIDHTNTIVLVHVGSLEVSDIPAIKKLMGL